MFANKFALLTYIYESFYFSSSNQSIKKIDVYSWKITAERKFPAQQYIYINSTVFWKVCNKNKWYSLIELHLTCFTRT